MKKNLLSTQIEALEDGGFSVKVDIAIEDGTLADALALQQALIGTKPAPAAEAPKPAPAAEAPKPAKPAAEAPKPAPAPEPAKNKAKPAPAPEPDEEDEEEDEDEDGLLDAMKEATSLNEVVQACIDAEMKQKDALKYILANRESVPALAKFDEAKLKTRVPSLWEALAD